jgi:hypothetical protein
MGIYELFTVPRAITMSSKDNGGRRVT